MSDKEPVPRDIPKCPPKGCFGDEGLGFGEQVCVWGGVQVLWQHPNVSFFSAEGDPVSPVPGGGLRGGQDPAGQPH